MLFALGSHYFHVPVLPESIPRFPTLQLLVELDLQCLLNKQQDKLSQKILHFVQLDYFNNITLLPLEILNWWFTLLYSVIDLKT